MKILSKIARIFVALLWSIATLGACVILVALSPLLCVILLISLFKFKPDEYIDEYTE